MTFGLYECLRAVGLQCHYARFTSVGVHRAAHLSALTMDDYPHLGVRTIEERTRLFDLVQLIRSLDLESLEDDDGDACDYSAAAAAAADGAFAEVISEFACGNPAEDASDETNEALAGPLCVRRRLDFSFETPDRQHNHASHPEDTVHFCSSNNRNTSHTRDGCPTVCHCKENKLKPGIYSFPSDRHMTESMATDITGGLSSFNSTDRLPSRCVSLEKPKLRSATSHASDPKTFGHKNGKVLFRNQRFCSDLDRNCSIGRMVKQTPVYKAARTAGYNYGLPLSVPASPHKKRMGEQRISVCVRKRPLTRTEKRRKEADVVTSPGGACVVVHEGKEAVDLTQYILQHKFYFDCVFGEESSNEEVYRSTAYPLVQHMLSGGSATCFAYGQTGAGKTHTMLGSSPGRPGLYALAVQDIFAYLSTTHTHSSLQVYVSFFEIYCGQLYDLLDHRKRLFAREDGLKVVHISGLRDVRVESVNSLLEVIQQGTEVRTQGMSGVNPSSSRSHALLQIQLRDQKQQIAGRMWFVDLAGSERASDTKEPDRQSRLEGAEINQSLLALKECIRSLDKEQSHTPFRQSKLTQVLKDSFVGDSMTCMIANISPGHTATEHTLNTLRYADRVKELKRGGLRGRGETKTTPSHIPSLSNGNISSSNGGTRGRSPPKKPKIGRQNKDVGTYAFTAKLPQGDTIFCSTPKSSRCQEEPKPMGRREVGLESVNPLKGSIGHCEKKHGSKGSSTTKNTRIDKKCLYPQHCSVREQSVRAGPVWVQPVDKLRISGVVQKERVPHVQNLSQTKKESDSTHKEKVKQECSMEEDSGEDRKWIELRKRVGTSGDTRERNSEKGFQKVDEARKMHLRRYHEQLQQFISSTTSSSFRHFSPSTLSSVSCTVASSSFPHPSCLSVSAHHDPEEISDTYSAKGEVRVDGSRGQLPLGSEVHLQTEHSPAYSGNNGVVDDSAPGDWRAVQQGRKARCEQDSAINKLEGATSEGGGSRDNKTAGMKNQQRRLAWGATQETDPVDGMTAALVTKIESQVGYNYDSEDRGEVGAEGLDASDAPADGGWSSEQEEAAGRYSPVSLQSSRLFSHPRLESHPQQAPAERPLSPARGHTFLTSDKLSETSLELKQNQCNADPIHLLLHNTSESVPFNSHRENKPLSCETTARLSTPITLSDFPKPPHMKKAKTSVLPQDNADSLSDTMDPLSISLLQVDQQAATTSFLQGSNNYGSFSQSESESRGGRKKEVGGHHLTRVKAKGNIDEHKDGEFHLSFLELPQMKPHVSTKCDSVTAGTQAEPSGMCRRGRTEAPMENSQRPQTMPLRTDTGSPSLHRIVTNAKQAAAESAQDDLKNPPASRTTPSAEGVPGRVTEVLNKCHSSNSNHSSHSKISLKLNKAPGFKGQEDISNQQMRQTIDLFTLDDFDHAKWCVVEAHWEQLKEMEALCHKEGMLLSQQPDMTFGDYVRKLEEIMEKKAECVHNMRAQLRPYLKTIQSSR